MSTAVLVPEPNLTLQRFIVQQRDAAGLSNSAVAARSGLTRTHVHNLQNGHCTNPTIGTIRQLAKAFNVPAAALAALALGSDEQATNS